MRNYKHIFVTLMIFALALPAIGYAQNRPKLPQSAYLKSAKIAMLDKNPRYEEALQFINEMIGYYGPVPEGYFLKGNIYSEFAARENDFNRKIEYFTFAAANYDSMFASCKNDDVKKNLKSDCRKFSNVIDSIKVYYWAENYNDGVKALGRIDEEILPRMKEAADSTEKEAASAEMKAVADSAKAYFRLAIAVDPTKYRPFEGVALTHDRLKEFDSSVVWFRKATDLEPDSLYLIQNTAYGYIQLNDWANAAEYFKKLSAKVPDDASTLLNIAICFNNMRMFDSAYIYDVRALKADTTLSAAFIDVGRYFLIKSQAYSDSIKQATQENKTAVANNFMSIRDNLLDSSAYYLGQGIKYEPENVEAIEQYGVVTLVNGQYEDAAGAFKRLTELEPFKKDHWINLGDIYIQTQKFEEAIAPLEKASELDPGDVKVWEVLRDLYSNTDNTAKANKAQAKIDELNKL